MESQLLFLKSLTIPLNQDEKMRMLHNPYLLAMCFCIGAISGVLKNKNLDTEEVMYIYEIGDQGQPEFTDAINTLVGRLIEFKKLMRIFSIMPGTKQQFEGLNAADMLAWEINHLLSDPSDRVMRPSFEKIMSDIPLQLEIYDTAKIKRMVLGDKSSVAARFNFRVGKSPKKRPYEW